MLLYHNALCFGTFFDLCKPGGEDLGHQAMDRKLAPEITRRRRLKRGLGVILSALVLLVAFALLRSLLRPTLDRGKILTAVAEMGAIEATISAAGVVVPEHEHVIGAPIRTEIQEVFLQTGDTVSPGRQILKLGCESLELELAEHQDQLELERNKKQQLMLRLKQQRAELQAEHEIKRLQVEYMKTRLRREQQLFAIGASN
jgi:HlyD family secretion protein